jgi:hypothetical protein
MRAFPMALLALGLLLLPVAVSPLRAALETEGEVAAREVALELAGAFSNDGYKIRDGHWSGMLQPRAPQLITVNLYAGNQYYFSLGATDKAKKVSVTVFDESGKQLAGEEFFQDPDKGRAAAGVSPVASGPYYVSIQLMDGAASEFCLLYSYK